MLGDLGTISIGLLYVFFALGGFVAPYLVRKLGAKNGMLLGSLTYIAFQLSLIYMITPIVLIVSVLIGCGGSLLWCAHG